MSSAWGAPAPCTSSRRPPPDALRVGSLPDARRGYRLRPFVGRRQPKTVLHNGAPLRSAEYELLDQARQGQRLVALDGVPGIRDHLRPQPWHPAAELRDVAVGDRLAGSSATPP